MPTHNIATANLQFDGPLLEIEVRVSTAFESVLTSRNMPIPNPRRGLAILDTGASVSAIQSTVLSSLGIPSAGNTPVVSAAGRLRTSRFDIRISFPALQLPLRDLNVLGVNLGNNRVIALIGRDIMRDWIMHYNGPAGTCSLTY